MMRLVRDTPTLPATGHCKLVEYFSVPSIHRYLIVNPAKTVVIHHARDQAGKLSTLIASSGEIELTPPGMSVPVAELLPAIE
jgi:hypothetical protein